MPDIIEDATVLRGLREGSKLTIFPVIKEDLVTSQPMAPMVVLIHGYQGSMSDMVNPTGKYAYDKEWVPPDINDGWNYFPPIWPAPLDRDLFRATPSLGDLEAQSWFTYFKEMGLPVLAYTQEGTDAPLDHPDMGAYPEFVSIMEELDQIVLSGANRCRKILLVGHSRGGLIAKRYVVEALNGTLGSLHMELVERRIRFLGTLNTPHFGSNLAALPDLVQGLIDYLVTASIPIPIVGDVIGSAVASWAVDELQEAFDIDENAVRELEPGSPMITDTLTNDLELLSAADSRMLRIRRASTSGDEPVLRRYFGPLQYTPESFVPDPERLLDYDELLDTLLDTLTGNIPEPPPFFYWRAYYPELPFSPVVQAKDRNQSLLDLATAYDPLLQSLVFPEFRAERDGPGGDYIVSNVSGHLLGADHLVVSRHHWNALWHSDYKSFVTSVLSALLPIFCYPTFTYKIGHNVVEVDWESIGGATVYQVYRWRGDSGSVDDRSGLLLSSQTLFYDVAETPAPLRYLVGYQLSTGVVAPPDYLESVPVGSVPLRIRCCRLNADVESDQIPIESEIAAAPIGKNTIIASINSRNLLIDSVNGSLLPAGDRTIAYTSGKLRISEPYALAPEKELGLIAWIDYGPGATPMPGQPDLPGSGSGTLSAGDEMSGSAGGSGAAFLDYTKFAYSVIIGEFDQTGIPRRIQSVYSGGNYTNQTQSRSLRGGPSISAPRISKAGKGYIVTWTAESGSLWSLEIDHNLQPLEKPLEIPFFTPLAFGGNLNQAGLVLHDLFPTWVENRYIALVELAESKILYAVSFTPTGAGGDYVVSKLSMQWSPSGPPGYKGALIGEDTFYIYLSYRANAPAAFPQYTTRRMLPDYHIESDGEWHTFSLEGIETAQRSFRVHDIITRSVDCHEVLFSATGFFQDNSVSSSLYRIRIQKEKNPDVRLLHHCAFGAYQVAFSRASFPLERGLAVWLTTNGSVFGPGLYGQDMLWAVKECKAGINWSLAVPNPVLTDLEQQLLVEAFCGEGVPGRNLGICDFLHQPELLLELTEHRVLRTAALEFIWELLRLGQSIQTRRRFPAELRPVPEGWSKVRFRALKLLDASEALNKSRIKELLAPLREGFKWEPRRDRARRAAEIIIKKAKDLQGPARKPV